MNVEATHKVVAAAAALPVPTAPVKPNATAATSFGVPLPKPQPPSLVWAMIGPAQSPESKPKVT